MSWEKNCEKRFGEEKDVIWVNSGSGEGDPSGGGSSGSGSSSGSGVFTRIINEHWYKTNDDRVSTNLFNYTATKDCNFVIVLSASNMYAPSAFSVTKNGVAMSYTEKWVQPLKTYICGGSLKTGDKISCNTTLGYTETTAGTHCLYIF